VIKIKAILLAAGYGTRLYPLTLNKPKPLLEINNKPMIEHIIPKIEEIADIDEIYVITNNKFYKTFVEWKIGYRTNKKIEIINDETNSDEDKLGAIGDMQFAIKNKNIDDDILIVAGDNLFEFSLRKLNDFFKEKNVSVIALYDVKDKNIIKGKYGAVEIDQNNKIIGVEEKPEEPKTTLASTACYIFAKKDIEELEKCIKDHNKPDNLGDFIKYLANKEDVYGLAFTERWIDIGSKEQLEEARNTLK
jgi:glucose-1-phosphate thymidylyltransferase|tara:strand:- start:1875 stop:2618 length:744 start_codon:yes stop_codon:yes gene_type:complete